MDSKRITLAIFGNQLSNSGFQPLYWINNPPKELENIVPPGMDDCPHFFTLQQLPGYTQLTLTNCRVSSFQSARPGVLKMAVAIPQGYRLSNGESLTEVLMHVYDTFRQTCMTQRDEHAATFNFCEKLPPASTFADIVNSYTLVPASDQLPSLGIIGDTPLLFDGMPTSNEPSLLPRQRRTWYSLLLALLLGLLLGALIGWLLKPGSDAASDQTVTSTAVDDEEDKDETDLPLLRQEPVDEEYELYGNDEEAYDGIEEEIVDDIVPPPDARPAGRRSSRTDTIPWKPEDYHQQHRNAKQSEPQPKQQTDPNGNKESKYQ